MRQVFFLLLSGLLMVGCGDSKPENGPDNLPPAEAQNKFGDPVYVQIAEAQDRRDTEALTPFLSHENEDYIIAAAMAFGSVQDSNAIEALSPLLKASPGQGTAAAYALGQTGTQQAIAPLLEATESAPFWQTRAAAYEALGKCGTEAELTQMLETREKEPALLGAQVLGVYRFGTRGITNQAGTDLAAFGLGADDKDAVLYGAAYLGRMRGLDYTAHSERITHFIRESRNDDAIQHLCRALGSCKSEACKTLLLDILHRRQQVTPLGKINAVRASASLPIEEVYDGLVELIKYADTQVAIEAARSLRERALPEHCTDLLQIAEVVASNWRAQSFLLAAAIRMAIKDNNVPVMTAAEDRAAELLLNSKNPYQKGHLLLALAESPEQMERILQALFAKERVVSTYAMEAMLRCFEVQPARAWPAEVDQLKKALLTGDVGIMAMAATQLRNKDAEYGKHLEDLAFLDEALDLLSLPKDVETYHEIERTKRFLEGKEGEPEKLAEVKFNNPIDWDLVKTIPAGQQVIMHTTRGDIRWLLRIEEAPGSVSNFVKLARKGFYDGAVFHRVVPNFVAQGGCPRGDGWGSVPETIRSEWPDLRYTTGAIGMASAGKDTESCQWFITHSSTPHLDGRYTIFAKVIDGMDVVQKTQMGDKVKGFEFVENNP